MFSVVISVLLEVETGLDVGNVVISVLRGRDKSFGLAGRVGSWIRELIRPGAKLLMG